MAATSTVRRMVAGLLTVQLIFLALVPPTTGQDTLSTQQSLPPGLTGEEITAGWLSLFDGESLYGWKSESQVDWQVVEGEIRATGGLVGLLRTTSQFGDYRLRLEFRSEATTNSGCSSEPAPNRASPTRIAMSSTLLRPTIPFPPDR